MNDIETGVDTRVETGADSGADHSQRLQRPTPQRQAPVRRGPLGLPPALGSALNGALGAALASSQTLGSGLGAAVQQGLDAGRTMSGAAEASVQGFVERGVNTAYQVIEEYMRRGQEAAQRLSPLGPGPASPGLAADAAAAWAQNLGGPLGQTASSMAVPWLQWVRAWADGLATLAPMAGQVAGQVAGQMAGQAPGPFGGLNGRGVLGSLAAMASPMAQAGAPPLAGAVPLGADARAAASTASARAAGPRAKVTIEFMSHHAAEVAVSLEPGADLAALHADWGDAASTAATAAPGSVVVYSAPGHVHVRLALSEPPVAGRHLAVLSDCHGQAWGSVSVLIAERGAVGDGPAAA